MNLGGAREANATTSMVVHGRAPAVPPSFSPSHVVKAANERAVDACCTDIGRFSKDTSFSITFSSSFIETLSMALSSLTSFRPAASALVMGKYKRANRLSTQSPAATATGLAERDRQTAT
jgi:hypothetical protein